MIEFTYRHIGPTDSSIDWMLNYLGYDSLDSLTNKLIPGNIQFKEKLNVPNALSETEATARLLKIAEKNDLFHSLIGQGYYGTITPPVIRRNILENPAWYSGYTPYQAEISQGRLEALFNFQTMVSDLTGLPIANASLLDEPTAVAEAIMLCHRANRSKGSEVFLSDKCHPQTIAICRARSELLGWTVVVGNWKTYTPSEGSFAAVVQYPETDGVLHDFTEFSERMHENGVLVVAATDLLALTLFAEPASWGADVAVGSTQRFGCPMGFGGPHAAFFATKEDYKRMIPGRIVGRSKDSSGQDALRLALQTREQHIRREKATSNICTAQVLPAVMASMFALYHGANNLRSIAETAHSINIYLEAKLRKAGYAIEAGARFDTIKISVSEEAMKAIQSRAAEERINLRYYSNTELGFSIDETVDANILKSLGQIFGFNVDSWESILGQEVDTLSKSLFRKTGFLKHPIFNRNRSELEITRYIFSLAKKDLTLVDSMIPLGSCTMKLNSASELDPVSWDSLNQLHPLIPKKQAEGYLQLTDELSDWLAEITGFHSVSLQPNSGASGEYAGLVAIRSYHESRGDVDDKARNICLIPESAHGTNPASASLVGFKVISIACSGGCVDLADLEAKAEQYQEHLGAFMLTYPSTYGIYESKVKEICTIIHKYGGQVYMDGANMNAMVGLCRPGDFGADVCHLNLHKTFCIPHGGGGPGSGPIGVAEHLAPFLPSDPCELDTEFSRPVAGANFGSALILSIPWMYIQSMGASGLKKASQVAILNANYMLNRLSKHYDILYRGEGGLVAHEGIIDLRPFKKSAGIDVNDVCKRLIDYGFHAPTMSWPVIGTIMIEPTESETIEELDRFVDAMIAIREEIGLIEKGESDAEDNVLKHAPFSIAVVSADVWPYSFSRTQAGWPNGLNKERKFWAPVTRIDNALGDRNLICSCPTVEELAN
jgi:glycine dehydrogenase